jgi:dihydrofolate reductase
MSEICMIAAAAENNALGKENGLLWRLPLDFKRFKELTTGFPMIMGRKTFDSLLKPLPNRKHLVITRNTAYTIDHEDCAVYHSLSTALEACKKEPLIYIIGGGEIYNLAYDSATKIELTRVHTSLAADAFFPVISPKDFKLHESISMPADEKHLYAYTFETYYRI